MAMNFSSLPVSVNFVYCHSQAPILPLQSLLFFDTVLFVALPQRRHRWQRTAMDKAGEEHNRAARDARTDDVNDFERGVSVSVTSAFRFVD